MHIFFSDHSNSGMTDRDIEMSDFTSRSRLMANEERGQQSNQQGYHGHTISKVLCILLIWVVILTLAIVVGFPFIFVKFFRNNFQLHNCMPCGQWLLQRLLYINDKDTHMLEKDFNQCCPLSAKETFSLLKTGSVSINCAANENLCACQSTE